MLERAKGCLEHGGRQLLRLPGDPTTTQRIRSGFWNHGAGDLDLSTYWLAMLSPTSDQLIARSGQSSLAASIAGPSSLDFLYPTKTLEFLHKLSLREAARSRVCPAALKKIPGSRTYIRHRKQSWMTEKTQDVRDEYENTWMNDGPLTQELDEKPQSSRPKRQKEWQWGDETGDAVQRYNRAGSQGLHKHGAATSVEQQEPEGTELWWRNHKSASAAPDQSRCRKQYQDRLFHYRQLLDESRRQHDSSPFTCAEIFKTGTQVLQLGNKTLQHARETFLEQVKSQDFRHWTEEELRTNMKLLSMETPLPPVFLDAFVWALDSGKAPIIMPILAERLIRSDWTVLRDRRLFSICGGHGERSPSAREKVIVPFWSWLLQGHGRTVEQLTDDFLYQLRKRRYGTKYLDPDLINSIFSIYTFLTRHKNFSFLDAKRVKSLHDRLRKVVEADAKYSSLKYENLCLLLKTLLFQGHFREHSGLLALSVFQAMERFGGYQGEPGPGPDLARKLFWRLANMNHFSGVQSVFANLRLREKHYAAEYSYILFKLSQTGRDQEFTELQRQFEAMQSPTGRSLSKSVGGRTKIDIYHDKLELFRRRNDVSAMLRIFQQIEADPKQQPNQRTYNLLISAHARVEDISGAETWLARLLEAGLKPNLYSYIPFMRIFARGGDIEAVRRITRNAEGHGIQLNDAVMLCHLRALVLGGALTDAKNLLNRTEEFHVRDNDKARLWDEVIHAYAIKGNKDEVNYLTDAMRQQDLEFTARTHASIMSMWCKRREPSIAEQYLRSLIPEDKSTAYQFAIVMKGYLDLDLHDRSVLLFDLMVESQISPDWSVKRVLVGLLEQATSGCFQLDKAHRQHFQKIVASSDPSDLATEGPFLEDPTLPRDEVYLTLYFQFLVSVAPGSDEVERVSYAWDAYVKYVEGQGQASASFVPPMSIMSRLLETYHRNKAWDRVEFCWTTIHKKAVSLASLKEHFGAAWSRRFILCQPLYRYMQSLAEQGMLNSRLKPLIRSLLNEGFILNSECWNLFIRLLILDGSKNYEMAFQTAERTIMRGWQGWPAPEITNPHSNKESKSLRSKLLRYARLQTKPAPRKDGGDSPDSYSLSFPLMEGNVDPKTQQDNGKQTKDGRAASTLAPPANDLLNDSGENAVSDSMLGSEDLPVPEPREVVQVTGQSELRASSESRYGLLFDSESSAADYDADPGQLRQRLTQDEEGDTRGVGIVGRPEYSTLVYLTRAFLDMRVGAAFDNSTRARIKELSRVAPKLVDAVLTMPRVDDQLQSTLLKRQ